MSNLALPPHNLAAEEHILGAMMLTPRAIDAVAGIVKPGDFYRESHARIFEAALELHAKGEPVDTITVADQLGQLGQLADAGGKEHIHEIACLVTAASNVAHHAKIVVRLAGLRADDQLGWELRASVAEGGLDNNPDLRARLAERLARPVGAAAVGLVFAPVEHFAAVEEPGAEALVRATAGGVVIPAGGLVLVYGEGGAGKTTLIHDLCFALATGSCWLGMLEPNRPLRVLIVENEGPRPELRAKLARKLDGHGGSLDGRISILETPWARFTFADAAQRQALADALTGHEADLLVVGPLSRVGMEGGGTLDDISRFEALLRNLRERVERPFAILIVHHENRAGQISGAWEGVPDTLMHVQGQGHGRTRVHWQKVRWSSALHGTSANLLWTDGDSFAFEDKPEVTPDTMATGILAAAREHPGASWTRIRALVTGSDTDTAKVRDRLLSERVIVNTATRHGYFSLWAADDPAATRSEPGTGRERLAGSPSGGTPEPTRSPVPYVSRNGERNGTGEPRVEDDQDTATKPPLPEAEQDFINALVAQFDAVRVADDYFSRRDITDHDEPAPAPSPTSPTYSGNAEREGDE